MDIKIIDLFILIIIGINIVKSEDKNSGLKILLFSILMELMSIKYKLMN